MVLGTKRPPGTKHNHTSASMIDRATQDHLMPCCMLSLVCTIRTLICLHADVSQKMSCPAFRLVLIKSAALITALTSQLFWYDAAIATSTSLLHFSAGCFHPTMPTQPLLFAGVSQSPRSRQLFGRPAVHSCVSRPRPGHF
jgi:hypothetical protein